HGSTCRRRRVARGLCVSWLGSPVPTAGGGKGVYSAPPPLRQSCGPLVPPPDGCSDSRQTLRPDCAGPGASRPFSAADDRSPLKNRCPTACEAYSTHRRPTGTAVAFCPIDGPLVVIGLPGDRPNQRTAENP